MVALQRSSGESFTIIIFTIMFAYYDESLFLQLLYPYFDFMSSSEKPENVVNYPVQLVNYPVQHLKVVEISGYCGGTIELELVKYFLENAVSLKKIIVDPRFPLTSEEPVYNYHGRSNKVQMEHEGRRCAKQQLVGIIPSHVTLEIL